ncbi:multicopper oxidase family protein [Sphingoaurantiacus capsulatus]|uniref:Multicopper oxidase family protein n=1 Tax=Sphingoaurantiacus capsulatus TaxID=1771310 RepID=A0ABV7XBZ9_9SPHN
MALGVGACAGVARKATDGPADVKLRIASHMLELAPGITYPTFAYDGQVPGPTLRLRRGRRTSFEIENHLLAPELVHWHGLTIPSDVDGAEEEGTPPVPPFGTYRFEMTPNPAGTHWYHTHMMGAKALMFGPYSGLFGFVIVEDGSDAGAYDQEVLVALHHWGSHWISGQELRPDDPKHGLEVGYRHGTMNGRLLGHGEPVRVRQGQRVLFRLLNASATEITWTALAGHRMKMVAMDGQPVPTQAMIDALMLGPGERADVLVEMNNPGRWILGAVKPQERAKGMGMIVEYAGAIGEAAWAPVKLAWDFRPFAHDGTLPPPDERILLRIDRIAGGPGGYNQWSLNGRTWPDTARLRLTRGNRYRLAFENRTTEGHPMHLHRHHFEVASYGGTPCAGLMKDTINIRPNSMTEVDFIASNPGPTLLHCHQAKHQDFGLMALMLYDGDVEPAFDPNAMHEAIEAAYCRSDRQQA